MQRARTLARAGIYVAVAAIGATAALLAFVVSPKSLTGSRLLNFSLFMLMAGGAAATVLVGIALVAGVTSVRRVARSHDKT